MNDSTSESSEQTFYSRMGVSVENALATGTDFVDEKISRAVESGVDVDDRLSGLTGLLSKLSEPATISALGELLEQLPQLAQLGKLASELPNLLAIVGDMVDDYQQRFAADGVDVEKAISNGLNAVLYLGSQVDHEHLQRIGDLLGSGILNPNALNVIDNAAKSLNSAQVSACGENTDRIGIFGMLAALRDPQIQRSLSFAAQFGKCFGKNLDEKNLDPSKS